MDNLIDYKIWCTYHDKKLLSEYNLKETKHFKLYYTQDISNEMKYSLNYAQLYLNEYTTQYYVWKNNIKSDIVAFCHYRRNIIDKVNIDFLNYINNYAGYYCFCCGIPSKGNNMYEYFNLSGLNIHNELLNDYISINYDKFIYDKFISVMHSRFVLLYKYGELYCCKWNIFCQLMEFIDKYIHFLFKQLLNIQYDSLIDYDIEDYKNLDHELNKINFELFKKIHIELNDYIEGKLDFCGSPRTIGYIIELLISVFFTVFYEGNNIT